MPKVKIETVVKDSIVEELVEGIIRVTKTGEIGDGKIFISNIENAVKIRTRESGESAI